MVEVNAKQNEGNLVDSPLPFDLQDGELPDFEKLFPDLMESDLLVFIQIFINLININYSEEFYDPDKNYNKKYFASYYGVDEKTFNGWVDSFLPRKFRSGYKKKRQFNRFDWLLIMSYLGQCDNKTRRPYKRSEIDALVCDESNFSFKEDLDRFLKSIGKKHNILPPKVVYSFLSYMDAPEIQHTILNNEKQISQRLKVRIFMGEIRKAMNMTPQERHKLIKQIKLFLSL